MKPEMIEYFGYLFDKVTSFFGLKLFCGFVWGALVYLFGTGQSEAILALFVLVIVDTVFAILAAKKTGEQITSAKFLRSPVKMTVYFALIACTHVSEYALPGIIGILDETMVASLVITELLSILEKAGKMGFVVSQKLLNQLENLRDGEPITSKK